MHKLLFVCGLGVSSTCFAAIQGMYFEHKDWEVACMNTGECQAVGYQAEHNPSIALLLKRKAGANTSVSAVIKVESAEQPNQAYIYLNHQNIGQVHFNRDNEAHLSSQQIERILASAQKNSQIELRTDQMKWLLSDQGLTANLMKMDDFQQRIGTTSALIAKGKKGNQQVLKAQMMPNYVVTNYRPAQASHYALGSSEAQTIMQRLKKTTNDENCPLLWELEDVKNERLTVYPLNNNQVLVQSPCWRGAYNMGQGMWMMSKDLKQVQQTVTLNASSFSEGQVFSHQKGRGLGDCGTVNEWAFIGKKFVQTYVRQSSQCKGFAGGAWQLPTFVSQVGRQ